MKRGDLNFKNFLGVVIHDLHEEFLEYNPEMEDFMSDVFGQCHNESEEDEMLKSLKKELNTYLERCWNNR